LWEEKGRNREKVEGNGNYIGRIMFGNFISSLYEQKVGSQDLERVKELVSGFYRIPKMVLDKVKVKFSSLPTIYLYIAKRVGDYLKVLYLPIGKILGLYDPLKKEIYVEKNIPYSQKIKTLLHEYVHAAQDYLGRLSNKSRNHIESEARLVSEYLFKIYSQASQRYPSSLGCLALI